MNSDLSIDGPDIIIDPREDIPAAAKAHADAAERCDRLRLMSVIEDMPGAARVHRMWRDHHVRQVEAIVTDPIARLWLLDPCLTAWGRC